MKLNILIVGVGGQGILLASKILGEIARVKGMDCKLNEIHGMAQRGGSVVTHVKIAPEVFSPIIEPGEADYLIAFEKLEALRWKSYLKPKGVMIVNDQEILPMPVILGHEKYPDNIISVLKNEVSKSIFVKALELATEIKNPRSVNVILLGIFCAIEQIEMEVGVEAVLKFVKKEYQKSNILAFKKGYFWEKTNGDL